MNKKVAIIGAGPAGATCAYELSKAGVDVTLFDHKVPWEKPCGGMLGPLVMEEFPFLREYPYQILEFNEFQFISPRSYENIVKLERPIYSISRAELGKYLLDRAIENGVVFVNKKVDRILKAKSGWHIELNTEKFYSDIIVGADGVHSITRKFVTNNDLNCNNVLSCGYFLDSIEEMHSLFNFSDFLGYMWIFPRPNNFSAGIVPVSSNKTYSGKDLFAKLDDFISDRYPEAEKIEKWSAHIPIINDMDNYIDVKAGKNWLLIGDAASNVDPITGEGIYFALKSGELAAQCIINKRIVKYNKLWIEEYGSLLKRNTDSLINLINLEKKMGEDVAGAFLYKYVLDHYN